ncbi:MAG: chromosome segregation protein SMC [Rhodothermales bacterium]|nr:chromosome segregation protein SMC [Rhodothermales bacterium]
MYLSKLELHGFKSFANRTSLLFDPGVTAVVGPNGCGKSNIVDAVRWVIGEQRARVLRSEKMENVIFNGTSKKRPLGMSEVMLTIENTEGILPIEYSEVTIGRRLYRSGESEYLMNGVQCRLKDITDLFMDTGMGAGAYSVIELKMVEEILSENTNDRRHLFEEAAGITKYKLRRSQTLRKLASTQVDLTRVQDLLEEIEKRVRSLKRQANKAARYKEIEGELRTLELALAAIEYRRLTNLRIELSKEITALQDSLEGQTAQHGTFEADLEQLRVRLVDREKALGDVQVDLNAHLEETRGLDTDRRLQLQRLQMGQKDLERLDRETVEAEKRLGELNERRVAVEQERDAARPEYEKALQILSAAEIERDRSRTTANEARDTLAGLREEEQLSADNLADSRRALDRMASQIELLEDDRQATEKQRQQIDLVASEATQGIERWEAEFQMHTEAVDKARTTLATVRGEKLFLETELEEAQTYLRSLQSRREALIAQVHLLESVIASYDDFSESVQYLASNETVWSSSGLRTVSDIISCESRYRLALDNALKDYAGCIVVEDRKELHAAIAELSRESKGRASFIVLDQLKTIQADSADDATPLYSIVNVLDEKYRNLSRTILAGSFLAETNEAAERLALESGYGRFYVPTGAWFDSRGIVHGGSDHGQPSSIMGRLDRRRQLEQAKKDLAALVKQIADQERSVKQTEDKLSSDGCDTAEAALANAIEVLRTTENGLNRSRFERETIDQRREELDSKRNQLAATLDQLKVDTVATRSAVSEAEARLQSLRGMRAEAEDSFHSLEAESRMALSKYSEASVLTVETRNRFDNLEKDLERIDHAVSDLAKRAETRIVEQRTIADQISKGEEELARLDKLLAHVREGRPALEDAVAQARESVMEIKVSISDLESELRDIRRAKEEQMREESNRAVKLAEVATRLEDLLVHVEEDYGIKIVDITESLEPDTEESDARNRVKELRQQVRSIGPVNELALEEYEEEKERLDFISSQFEDLKKAEHTLIETIDEINTTASKRFNETFEAIRTNFQNLFAQLFGDEAAGNIELTNPSDPLESPVEVYAKPRGKRPSVLAQLSGGEKTLTAIALLFAIYLVKPSPFCILDEVDAPLDDANVGRFMQLIREFSKSTQFILVTHNKRTMEAADRMYGITMQEQGISKLVGVNFEPKEEDSSESVELEVVQL